MTDAQLASVYAEVLAVGTPEAVIEATYLEVLTSTAEAPAGLSVADSTATATAAATLETVTLPLALLDALATATAAAALEALTLPTPLTLDDQAATATATATAEAVAFGLDLTDEPATTTAAAWTETVLIPVNLTDATATAAADAALETVGTDTGLTITDTPATANAAATTELLTGAILSGWSIELVGQATAIVTTDDTDLYVPPAPATIPDAVTPRLLFRNSQQMEPLTEATPTRAETDLTAVNEDLGTVRVWVDGVDRTYGDDGELLDVDDLISESGYGDRTATMRVNDMPIYAEPGVGSWSWLRPGAQVEVGIAKTGGGRVVWWAGDAIAENINLTEDDFTVAWDLVGPMVQLATATMQPLDRMNETDIGIVIPRVVNSVISHRYPRMRQVRTGITTRKRGAYGQKVADYVRELLATAWVGDRQWRMARSTTNPRRYELVLTDTTTVHWTVTAGAHGVRFTPSQDWTQNANAIYGRGTLPNGHRWMNRKYPYLLPYEPPEYFDADPDAFLALGSTDADTRNDGVSLLQRRLDELGYNVDVTGVYGVQTQAAVYQLQRDRGLLIDGVTAGQTWTSVWSIGATGANLRSVRRPLATDPRVEPWLYLANGAIAEPNPLYVRSWPRVEDDLDYGENTTLPLGRLDAQQRVDRALEAPLSGTMTLSTCPWEGSRWEIQSGQNILLKGWRGRDWLLHVADIRRNRKAGTVTLSLDSAFRDALTVREVRQRRAESRNDPARRPGVIGRTRSTSAPDMTTPFDGESPAGKLPELTLRANLWSVWPLAIDQVGTLARVWMRTSLPACRFAVLLFGQEVLPSQLHAHVGLVLSQDRPWASETVDAWLEAHGFIDGWGHSGEACGYQPGSQAKGDPVTGKFEVRNPVSYVSIKPPFVWVGMLAEANCRIVGEFDPKPVT